MTRIRLAAAFAALAVTASLAGLSFAQDPSQVVTTVCTKCHNTNRICVNLGVMDKAGWDTTVTRMIGKGAALSPAQKPVLVDWLSTREPKAKPVCE
ncbi:MAG: hypothetical protein ACLGSA_05805 [Acidobacteriota bacterium]